MGIMGKEELKNKWVTAGLINAAKRDPEFIKKIDAGKKRVSSSDREMIMLLMGISDRLATFREDKFFWRLMERVPYGKRDFGRATGILLNMVESLMDSIPFDQVTQIRNTATDMVFHCAVRRTDKHDDTGHWISYDNMRELMMAVTDSKCKYYCSGEGDDFRKCKLRRALDALAIGMTKTDEERKGICPYNGFVLPEDM